MTDRLTDEEISLVRELIEVGRLRTERNRYREALEEIVDRYTDTNAGDWCLTDEMRGVSCAIEDADTILEDIND